MYTTNLRKVGGSVMMIVPPAILGILHLEAGSYVNLAVDHGCIVIEPKRKPHYDLKELLAQCNSSEEINDEDQAWLNNKPLGNELL